MLSKSTLAVIIGVIVVAGVIVFQVNETMWKKASTEEYYEKECQVGCDIERLVYPENPQSFYGLQINKDKYLLGENIYVIVTDVPNNLKTKALFYTPTGKQFYEINIDGEKNSSFKQYFKPQLLQNRSLCDVNELIGKWSVTFLGLPGEMMQFEVVDEYLPQMEQHYTPASCGKSLKLPFDPDYVPPP